MPPYIHPEVGSRELPVDPQELIDHSQSDELLFIRELLLDSHNMNLILTQNNHLTPEQFQTLGTVMLFLALERNSDLVGPCLRFLNSVHRMFPVQNFVYDDNNARLAELHFNGAASEFQRDMLMTLYACIESPYSGARSEALVFFKRYASDSEPLARAAFVRILYAWPWTNRNKYYLLGVLFDVHTFDRLLGTAADSAVLRTELVRGLSISLQYRNLIAPGQTLAITLTRQCVPEMFDELARVLREAPRFEAMNCLTHWMRSVDNIDRVYERLELYAADLLTGERFAYLRHSNYERLVMFRLCFERQFAAHTVLGDIDAIVEQRPLGGGTAGAIPNAGEAHVKLAQLDVLVANTIAQPERIVENLRQLSAYMAYIGDLENASMRQSTLKMVPNLLYMLAPLCRRPHLEQPVRAFFGQVRRSIFEAAVEADDVAELRYAPVVFAVRLFDVIVRTLHGSREDRLIKRFDASVNERLRRFLDEQDTWPLLSERNYGRLFALLRCEFDDVRETCGTLLVRFFPANDIRSHCVAAMQHTDPHMCARSQFFARVAIGFDSANGFYVECRAAVRAALNAYAGDPLHRMHQPAGHLFGSLDTMNEFHVRRVAPCNEESLLTDVRLLEDIVDVVLGYLQCGTESRDECADGSASFERMDENLTALVDRSAYGSDGPADRDANKKWLLLSLWSALRAACALGASIGEQVASLPFADHEQIYVLKRVYALCTSVLVRCRHKGAIEAAGLSLGRLVRTLTSVDRLAGDASVRAFLVDSVQRVFDMAERTDTTRRGAGMSILVHQLVRNERTVGRPLLATVMRMLLTQSTEADAVGAAASLANRDNRLAIVLHFLGTLVKDGDLRTTVTYAYATEIFALAMKTIDERDWTVRNAALQLIGSFVPKLVGQTQYFENDLDWQPVFMAYADVRRKMRSLHEQMAAMLPACGEEASVRLVTLLELLSHIEVCDSCDETDTVMRAQFYRLLRCRSEKVRTLAARCLARFHQWYEIPAYVRWHAEMWSQVGDLNFRHGILRSLEFMLLKWRSDSRQMPPATGDRPDLLGEVRAMMLKLQTSEKPVGSYFLRCHLYDVLRLVGCDRRQAAWLPATCDESVAEYVARLRETDDKIVGFGAWSEKVLQNVQ